MIASVGGRHFKIAASPKEEVKDAIIEEVGINGDSQLVSSFSKTFSLNVQIHNEFPFFLHILFCPSLLSFFLG